MISHLTRRRLTRLLAQTDIKAAGQEPSADDFLAREKALLGDDAEQFATSGDAAAFDTGNDDLLGGSGGDQPSTFESQFPDLANQNEVRSLLSVAKMPVGIPPSSL